MCALEQRRYTAGTLIYNVISLPMLYFLSHFFKIVAEKYEKNHASVRTSKWPF